MLIVYYIGLIQTTIIGFLIYGIKEKPEIRGWLRSLMYATIAGTLYALIQIIVLEIVGALHNNSPVIIKLVKDISV